MFSFLHTPPADRDMSPPSPDSDLGVAGGRATTAQAAAGTAGTPVPLPPPDDPPEEAAGLYRPHSGPDGYFNPWRPYRHRFSDVLRWWTSSNPYDKSGSPEVSRVEWDGRRLGDGPSGAVTWIGHASFALEDGGTVVLTDPHFGSRALVPKRVLPPGVPLEAVPDDAIAVLSHNHYDHLDRWTVRHLPEGVHWYVPPGLEPWFRRLGVGRVTEVDWWHRVHHPGRDGAPGWTLTALPAQHWSNRISLKRDSTLWCSWLLEAPGDSPGDGGDGGGDGGRRYFFAGDSGYFPGFAEYGRRFPRVDVALLPIGAYEPRWFMAYQHLDPAQAYRAFRDLEARFMLGMHWGTFDLTDEPVDRGPRELERVLEAAGGDPRVHVPAVGERWLVPPAEEGP